jgi:Ca-activated chloride channel family protein
MINQRTRLSIAGALLGATALAGAVAARRLPAPPVAHPTKATVTAPASGPVTFTGTLDRTSVLRGGDGIVRMELTMRGAPDVDRLRPRRPTDLVIVLDRSGSMMGEKIEHARAAVRELVSQLAPDDRFALVTYSDGAELAIPLTTASPEVRGAWLATIASISADGNTNMSGGLDLAMGLIERARGAGRNARAILISDGLANQGDATAEGLRTRAGRAARGEYVLSTVGVGADFNEYLMRTLADAGTGNYYYLQHGVELASVFASEFDAARTTVASALAVEVEPADGVRVVDAGGYPLEQSGSTVRFRPGSLFAGQERRIWLTLTVPHGATGDHDLGRVALAYARGDAHERLELAALPRVACVAGEDDFYAGIDAGTWARSVVVDSYNKMQEEVAREVKAGRRDAALDKVRQFKAAAEPMNERLKAPAVAAQILSADRLEKDVASAFEGENQAAKQNDLSKAKSLRALDDRRVGAKK